MKVTQVKSKNGSNQRQLDTLHSHGLCTKKGIPVKVLAKGEITKPLTVHAHKFSAAAREAIEAAGGTCQVIEP